MNDHHRDWSTGLVDIHVEAPATFLEWLEPFFDQLTIDEPRSDMRAVVSPAESDQATTEHFDLEIDGQLCGLAETKFEVLRRVVSQLTRRTHDRTPQKLHIDAGLVGFGGSSVLIHGPRHGGTSTLIAALSQLPGARYGSDHAVAVDSLTNQMHTWPSPILLRPGGAAALDFEALGGDTVTVPFAPWSRTQSAQRSFSPAVIIQIEYGDELPTRITPLHPTDAALRLIATSTDRTYPETDNLEALRQLTAHTRCFSIQHDLAPDAAARLVYGLVTDDGPHEAPPERSGVFASAII